MSMLSKNYFKSTKRPLLPISRQAFGKTALFAPTAVPSIARLGCRA